MLIIMYLKIILKFYFGKEFFWNATDNISELLDSYKKELTWKLSEYDWVL